MEQNQVIAEGVPEEQGKFCADCTHLIGVRYAKEEAEKRWKCGNPKNTVEWKMNNVTGIKYRIFSWNDIMHVREQECKGNWYEKYEHPEYHSVDTIGGEEPVIFDEAAMAAGKEAAAKRLADLKARKGIK